LGSDAGTEGDAGEFVRRALETTGIPERSVDEETESDETEDTAEDDLEMTDDDSDGTDEDSDPEQTDAELEETEDEVPGFGVLTGAAGIAGGIAYALRNGSARQRWIRKTDCEGTIATSFATVRRR